MGLSLRAALLHTGGRLVYALDDAYIHMAVGRSLAEHGVWGLTRHGFTSCTSSLLWPLLLAVGHLLAGAREALPLVLNLVACLAVLVLGDRLLRGAPLGLRLAALLGLVLLVPLPILVLSGMEHALHIAAVFWLLDRLRAVDEGGDGRRGRLLLGLAAALATSLRYESLFLVLPAAALLLGDGRRRAAVVTALAGLAPPAAFAVVSVAQGWPPLPNSVLLKRAAFERGVLDRLGGQAVRTLSEAPHLLVLLVAVLALLALAPASRALRRWGWMLVAATLLHLQLAAVGWLFRYEAYLVALGLVLVTRHLADLAAALPRTAGARLALALAGLAASAPLLTRATEALRQGPAAVKNIYEQQVQMGLLLRGLPPGSTVMANDVGAIAWLADVRVVDLFGLATQETARARRAGGVDRALLSRLAAETRPAAIVIYRSFFPDAVPHEWVEVGAWRVREKVVVADRTVSFFAPDAATAAPLARLLASFQPRLPAAVAVRLADARPR